MLNVKRNFGGRIEYMDGLKLSPPLLMSCKEKNYKMIIQWRKWVPP